VARMDQPRTEANAPVPSGTARDRVETTTPRGDERRALIVDTALRLFERDGYEKTTMRAIAREAGISVGNAYYYFASKNHLIQYFYDVLSDQHIARALNDMRARRDLAGRLAADLNAWVDVAEPYRELAAQFAKNAMDPNSPLSPFSPESEPARDKVIEIHRRAVLGSTAKVDSEILESLPDLLWMYHLGVVLFWTYDRSPGARRTRELIARTTPMVARVIGLSRFKIVRPLFREVDKLVKDFLLTPAGPEDGDTLR